MSPKVAYSGLQFTNAAECATPDTPVREQSKEAFDLVEPTDVGVAREPLRQSVPENVGTLDASDGEAKAHHFSRGYVSSGFRLLCGLLTRDTRSVARCGYRVMPFCDEPKGLLLCPLAAPDSQAATKTATHI